MSRTASAHPTNEVIEATLSLLRESDEQVLARASDPVQQLHQAAAYLKGYRNQQRLDAIKALEKALARIADLEQKLDAEEARYDRQLHAASLGLPGDQPCPASGL